MGPRMVLVLADGQWDSDEAVRALRRDADWCLAADGAWAKADAAGVVVDAVIGDLDSLSDEERARLDASGIEILRYADEKDWTDLELALDHALRSSPQRIVLYGALGGRLDHSLTNIHLLEKGLAANVPVECVSGDETVRLVDGPLALAGARVGDRVSLVPISESVRLSTEGLAYELRGETLFRAASRGVSNVVRAVPVKVLVADGRLLVLHHTGLAREDA